MADNGKAGADDSAKNEETPVEDKMNDEVLKNTSADEDETEKVEKEQKVIYCKLNAVRAAFWASDDGSLTLSLAAAAEHGAGRLYGSTNKLDFPLAYKQVLAAIELGLLLKVSKREYESNKDLKDKVPYIELNGQIEKKFLMRRKCESLLRLEGEGSEAKIIEHIKNQGDPEALLTMQKIEETGKKRPAILRELDVAVRKTESSGMSAVVKEDDSTDYTFTRKQIRTRNRAEN